MKAPLGQRCRTHILGGLINGPMVVSFYPKACNRWRCRINPLFLRKWRGIRNRGRAALIARRAARARLKTQEIDHLAQATIKRFRQNTASKLPWWTKGTSTFETLINRVVTR